ncbi:unnamed protein product, partial [Didymodactylos carnosus]
ECERGYSASNRIQTDGRSRIMIDTLDCLLSVRLLLPDDIRSVNCHRVIENAFNLWNDPEANRRWRRTKLIIDVPQDYEPTRQIRPTVKSRKRTRISMIYSGQSSKPKKPRSTAVKCANGCKRTISSNDPLQEDAIQCCHQNDFNDWVEHEDNCSRWLCNVCRILLSIPVDSTTWFCEDHLDMHIEEEEEIKETV